MSKKSTNKIRVYIRSLLREIYLSHASEPDIGDAVVNTNPSCKHHRSEGIVLSIGELAHDVGKTATYRCTNAGDNWDKGDVLTKTLDQLSSHVP